MLLGDGHGPVTRGRRSAESGRRASNAAREVRSRHAGRVQVLELVSALDVVVAPVGVVVVVMVDVAEWAVVGPVIIGNEIGQS